jgi:hypothetical protein
MSSASSPVKAVLEEYVAGRVNAERVAVAVAAAYYGERGARSRERLRPVMDVIERAHPGVVELAATSDRPGFAVRLDERSFPREFEPALRAAVQAVLVGAQHALPLQNPAARTGSRDTGFVARLVTAIRHLFTAST